MRLFACACVWTAYFATLGPVVRASGADVASELAALSAPSAEQRERAARWLGARLEPDDQPRLVAFLATAGVEPRARLVDLLGADERHFELSRRLALSNDVAARAIGVRAVREHVERWLGAPDAPPRIGFAPGQFLRDSPATFRLELEGRTLEATVDRIARRAGRAGATTSDGESVPLVLDGALAADAARAYESRAELVGDWNELVTALAARFDASVTVYGSGGERAFVVLARRAGAYPNSVSQWLLLASRVAFDAADPNERERAARALVASEFTPAIDVLARRYAESRDPAWLSALAQQAARGRVALELCDVAALRELRVRGETALTRDDPHAEFVAAECARALANLGDARAGAHALDVPDAGAAAPEPRVLEVLAEGVDEASASVLAWRFTVARLARVRIAALVERAEALLTRAANDSATPDTARAGAAAFEYLATLVADPRGAPERAPRFALAPGAADTWLAAERNRGRGAVWLALFPRAGVAYPSAWTPERLGAELGFVRFACEWRAEPSGAVAVEPELCARFLALLRADLPELAASGARVEEWRQSGRRDAVLALIDAAHASLAGPAGVAQEPGVPGVPGDSGGSADLRDALRRLEVRLALRDGVDWSALGRGWLAAGADAQVDWEALGALAATPLGPEVRQRLLAELGRLAADASPFEAPDGGRGAKPDAGRAADLGAGRKTGSEGGPGAPKLAREPQAGAVEGQTARRAPGDAGGGPRAASVARGVERAVLALQAAGATDEAAEFLKKVDSVLARGALGRFSDARQAGAWPAPPSRRPIDLDAKDLPDGL
ncbi:MAG: hypothetical protein L6Q99_16375 [Planctomycetes bacterium]|nr:hypothetical protein [Planctomycetota bacterium]